MKVLRLLEKDIHDHYIIIAVIGTILMFSYFNIDHTQKVNCHLLEPAIKCEQRGFIQRSDVASNPQFVYIDHKYSFYHMDEFRQKPEFGNLHVECDPLNNTCPYHSDTFNAVIASNNAFNAVAHLADNISASCWQASIIVGNDCFGVPDEVGVIIIWTAIIAIPYYSIKIIYLHRKSILTKL